jgi:predicted alpha-1,6-mannanase (GH76 family)
MSFLRSSSLCLLLGLSLSSVACASPDDASNSDDGAASSAADVKDGSDPAHAQGTERVAATATVWGRSIRLHLSDADDAGWASIDDGDAGDEAWLDRSFDNGLTWDGRVGKTKIPNGSRGWRTLMFNIDDGQRVGALRACGKAGNRAEIACTPWFRGKAHSATPLAAAAASLMAEYDAGKGLWQKIGWWNSANALTAIIDYSAATNDQSYRYAIDNTFEKNKRHNLFETNFTNDYMDDTGWWGLAWVRAYDLTGDSKYLDMAKKDADYIYSFKDDTCGGGVWWSKEKKYKNAITNELFIKLSAAIHNRIGASDTKYLGQAYEVWRWFSASGMINGQHLINDGLDDQCRNNNGTTWTYNQGVILGGLVELAKGTNDASLLDAAKQLADASTSDAGLNPNGILREPCESSADHCGGDGPSFKGIYARNLGELNRAAAGRPYDAYLARQAASIAKHQDALGQVGVSWAADADSFDAARQHSAVDALTAAR